MIKRYYFYTAVVHYDSERREHINGVIEITSIFQNPKEAWKAARIDIVKTMMVTNESAVQILQFNRI